jgi:uncharacterized membrane protein YgcG
MNCPACQLALHEYAAVCPHCGLDLPAVERLFGIPPRLEPDLTDLAGVLSRKDRSRIAQHILEKQQHLPQIRFAVVLTRLAPQTPLGAYTFWIFNRGSLASPMERGGACRLVLLVLDVESSRLSCMVGYGLEPLLSQATLGRITGMAISSLQESKYTEAMIKALDQASTELVSIAQSIPQSYGLEMSKETPPSLSTSGEAFAY